MVRVKNNSTGIESTFTDAEWENVKNNPMWKDVFSVVQAGETKKELPKELQDLGNKSTKQPAKAEAPKEVAKAAVAEGKETPAETAKSTNGKNNKP